MKSWFVRTLMSWHGPTPGIQGLRFSRRNHKTGLSTARSGSNLPNFYICPQPSSCRKLPEPAAQVFEPVSCVERWRKDSTPWFMGAYAGTACRPNLYLSGSIPFDLLASAPETAHGCRSRTQSRGVQALVRVTVRSVTHSTRRRWCR